MSELREAIVRAIWDHMMEPYGDDADITADAILALPEVEAWAERRARERVAEELRAAAASFVAEPDDYFVLAEQLRDRADALDPPT